MQHFSFKNRIAFYYILATAGISLLAFLIVYYTVYTAVYQTLDRDLYYEAEKHTGEIFISGDSILFAHKNEWREREHVEIQINPVFIQIVDKEGRLMDKSPNLKGGQLTFFDNRDLYTQFDTKLKDREIRQIQVPIEKDGVLLGYILSAMSQEEALRVLNNLRDTLLILFPIVLVGLFFISRFLAGRSIRPIQAITQTANRIHQTSLEERVSYPEHRDELYELTASINGLLDRIQDALEREKQFTSDASHQLRTPLAVLKGTLEVLIRKSRSQTEYETKIKASIQEIDRISATVNQLLLLARLDQRHFQAARQEVNPVILVDEIFARYKNQILAKDLSLEVQADEEIYVLTDPYYLELIFDNLLSNAIKYSTPATKIEVSFSHSNDALIAAITDYGELIPSQDLELIFRSFYRSDQPLHPHIKGNGLGLSIVKKICDLLGYRIVARSTASTGTTFELTFPQQV